MDDCLNGHGMFPEGHTQKQKRKEPHDKNNHFKMFVMLPLHSLAVDCRVALLSRVHSMKKVHNMFGKIIDVLSLVAV